MAKPNYAFEKRQRDLAKAAKKTEKRQRKSESKDNPPVTDSPEPITPAATVEAPTAD